MHPRDVAGPYSQSHGEAASRHEITLLVTYGQAEVDFLHLDLMSEVLGKLSEGGSEQ